MNEMSDKDVQQWLERAEQDDFFRDAILRLRFKNRWTKEELCTAIDVSVTDLHKYMKGEVKPPEAMLRILLNELEAQGPQEKRGMLRMAEMLDWMIELDRRVVEMEGRLEELERINWQE